MHVYLSSYDVEVRDCFLVPLWNVLLEGMLRDTEANEFVVLDILWLLRVQLSSHKIIIGVLVLLGGLP